MKKAKPAPPTPAQRIDELRKNTCLEDASIGAIERMAKEIGSRPSKAQRERFLLKAQEWVEGIVHAKELPALIAYLYMRSQRKDDLYMRLATGIFNCLLDHPLRLATRHDMDILIALRSGLGARWNDQEIAALQPRTEGRKTRKKGKK